MDWLYYAIVYGVGTVNGYWLGEMFCGKCAAARRAKAHPID